MYLGIVPTLEEDTSAPRFAGARGVEPTDAVVLARPEENPDCTFPVVKMGPREIAMALIDSRLSSEELSLSEVQYTYSSSFRRFLRSGMD
jgi:hypothetical protein